MSGTLPSCRWPRKILLQSGPSSTYDHSTWSVRRSTYTSAVWSRIYRNYMVLRSLVWLTCPTDLELYLSPRRTNTTSHSQCQTKKLGVKEAAQQMGEQPSLLHTIHDHINLHATCGEGIVVHRRRATIFQRPERERNGPANRKIPGPSHKVEEKSTSQCRNCWEQKWSIWASSWERMAYSWNLNTDKPLVKFFLPKLPKALARFLEMVQYYKHFLKNLSNDSTDLHQLKTQTFSEMPA